MAVQFNLNQAGIIATIVSDSAWANGFTRQNQRLNATLFYLAWATGIGGGGGPSGQDLAELAALVASERSYWVAKRDSSAVEVNTSFDLAVALNGYTGTKDAVSEWRNMVALGATGFNTASLAAAIDLVRTQFNLF